MKRILIIIFSTFFAFIGCGDSRPSSELRKSNPAHSPAFTTNAHKKYGLIQCEHGLGTVWEKLPENDKNQINRFLVLTLGLSSTGTIELIGVYNTISSSGFSEQNDLVLHFVQKDLFGDRLFWSCLLNMSNAKAKVIYHCGNEPLDKPDFKQWRNLQEKNNSSEQRNATDASHR